MKVMVQKVLESTWIHLQKEKLQHTTLYARDVQNDTNIDRLLNSRIGFCDFQSLQAKTKKECICYNTTTWTLYFFSHILCRQNVDGKNW